MMHNMPKIHSMHIYCCLIGGLIIVYFELFIVFNIQKNQAIRNGKVCLYFFPFSEILKMNFNIAGIEISPSGNFFTHLECWYMLITICFLFISISKNF